MRTYFTPGHTPTAMSEEFDAHAPFSYDPVTVADKTVVVVGGTSGIGRGIALACAEEGANVVPTSRTAERRLVLSQLPEVPTHETLEIARAHLDDEELKDEAAMAMVGVAEGLASSDRDAAVKAVKTVLDKSENDAVKDRAREALDEIQKYAGYIQDWLLAGPYTEEGKGDAELFDTVFPPEKDGAGVDWKKVHLSGAEHIVVDLDERLGGKDRVAYLHAEVWSEAERKARLELGSDDGVKAWLNSSVVHENNTNRGISPGQDETEVTLEKGWNTLLLKITQGGGNWAASARFRAVGGGKLEGLRIRPGK